MGKSFVLKDASGRPGGYLMQSMREICCRADSPAQQAVLLFEDGTAETHALCGGQEARWPCGDRLLRGGFVCAEDRLLLATGEETRGAFVRWLASKRALPEKKRPAEGSTPELALKSTPLQENKQPIGTVQKPREWPQRRWPPPPCWPAARYVQGCWQETE